MHNLSIIITAGGIGKRMGSAIPKQFLLLAGRPILMRTIEKFAAVFPSAQFIVTLPKIGHSTWENLCEEYNFSVPVELVDGGLERFHSVKNALDLCDRTLVMIHDAVRPLVSTETLLRGIESLKTHEASIPVVPVVDSLRQIIHHKNKAVNRSSYCLVQTPQCFHLKELKRAYLNSYSTKFTDDASVMEAMGISIHLFDGNRENLKITDANDLNLAEFMWRKSNDAQ